MGFYFVLGRFLLGVSSTVGDECLGDSISGLMIGVSSGVGMRVDGRGMRVDGRGMGALTVGIRVHGMCPRSPIFSIRVHGRCLRSPIFSIRVNRRCLRSPISSIRVNGSGLPSLSWNHTESALQSNNEVWINNATKLRNINSGNLKSHLHTSTESY